MDDEIERLSSVLKDVEPENCFWVNNGPIVRNIYELMGAIQHMKDETFKYHVNNEKNDFSTWIRDALNDAELVEELLKTTEKNKTLEKIRGRVEYIEREIDRKRKKEIVEAKEEGIAEREFSWKRVVLDLIVSFILGLTVGIVIGILIEHYSLIPIGWF